MKNLNDRRIYSYILDLIKQSPLLYTKVTNTQIANHLNISVFTVRDKIIKMRNKQYLNCYLDYFDENNTYVQRKITKGDVDPSMS